MSQKVTSNICSFLPCPVTPFCPQPEDCGDINQPYAAPCRAPPGTVFREMSGWSGSEVSGAQIPQVALFAALRDAVEQASGPSAEPQCTLPALGCTQSPYTLASLGSWGKACLTGCSHFPEHGSRPHTHCTPESLGLLGRLNRPD